MLDTAWLFRVEGARRTLTGAYALDFNLVAIGFSGFYLYTSGFGLVSTQSNRGIYLMLTSVLVFLLYPARKGAPDHRPSAVDLVLIAATVLSIGYWIDQYVSYAMFRVSSPSQMDLVMGAVAILAAVCRRWPVGRLRVADRGIREGLLLAMMKAAADSAAAPQESLAPALAAAR